MTTTTGASTSDPSAGAATAPPSDARPNRPTPDPNRAHTGDTPAIPCRVRQSATPNMLQRKGLAGCAETHCSTRKSGDANLLQRNTSSVDRKQRLDLRFFPKIGWPNDRGQGVFSLPGRSDAPRGIVVPQQLLAAENRCAATVSVVERPCLKPFMYQQVLLHRIACAATFLGVSRHFRTTPKISRRNPTSCRRIICQCPPRPKDRLLRELDSFTMRT